MSCLSVQDHDGMFTICANPIFTLTDVDLRTGAKIIFEVLESNASRLKKIVGQRSAFALGSSQPPFIAELASLDTLEPGTSESISLLYMRNRPTLRGVLVVQGQLSLGRAN